MPYLTGELIDLAARARATGASTRSASAIGELPGAAVLRCCASRPRAAVERRLAAGRLQGERPAHR